jgi:hypothetical protein
VAPPWCKHTQQAVAAVAGTSNMVLLLLLLLMWLVPLIWLLLLLLLLPLVGLLQDWHRHPQGARNTRLHDHSARHCSSTSSTRVHCHRAAAPVTHPRGCHHWHYHHGHTPG